MEKKYSSIEDVPFEILFKAMFEKSEGYTLDGDRDHRIYKKMIYDYLHPDDDESIDTDPEKST